METLARCKVVTADEVCVREYGRDHWRPRFYGYCVFDVTGETAIVDRATGEIVDRGPRGAVGEMIALARGRAAEGQA